MSDVENVDPEAALAGLEQAQRVTDADARMYQGPWWTSLIMGTIVTLIAMSVGDVGPGSLWSLLGVLLIVGMSKYMSKRQRIQLPQGVGLRPGPRSPNALFVWASIAVAFAVGAAYWALVLFWPDVLDLELLPVGLIVGWFFSTGVMFAQWFVVERRRRQLVSS